MWGLREGPFRKKRVKTRMRDSVSPCRLWRAFAERRLEDAVLLRRNPGTSRCTARSCVCSSCLPLKERVLVEVAVRNGR